MASIHLNTAGAGLMPGAVVARMAAWHRTEAAWGAYEAEARADEALQAVRSGIAALCGAANAGAVALFDSATRAWHSAVVALAPLPEGARLWVTPYEYAGNLIALQHLARRDRLRIEVVPLQPDGELDLDWMARHAGPDLRLVSVVHVPSCCGRVQPVAAVGDLLARCAPQALYAVDACQSVGQIDIDVAAIGCDLLTAAGRKFLCGPRGTGFAVLGPRWLDALGPHLADLHAAQVESATAHRLTRRDARRLELAEAHLAAWLGLGVAVDIARTMDLGATRHRHERLLRGLQALPGLSLVAPGGRHSGIVTVCHASQPAADIVQRLRTWGLNAWCIDGRHTPLYLVPRGVDHAVRLSVHHYNDDADIDEALHAFTQLCAPRRARATETAT